jgi:hypothetical protein
VLWKKADFAREFAVERTWKAGGRSVDVPAPTLGVDSREMHSVIVSSRALLLVSSVSFALVARAQQPVAVPAARAPDAALLAAAAGQVRGPTLATARADLPGGEAVLLVASQAPARDSTVSFLLFVLAGNGAGGYAVVGHDEVRSGKLFGAPVVRVETNAHPVAPGGITATVGWKAADGSSEEQQVIYRQGAGRLTRLLAAKPSLTYDPASGREGVRVELEVLPTSTAGFRDLRSRTSICSPQGECGAPVEVQSWIFDGVRYALRPYAIPFVEKVQASSELASSGAMEDHSGGAAVDGRPETAWCEGAPGPGWFQKLDLTFAPAQRLKAVAILPGGPKGEPFGDATRPKRVRILLPDKRKVEADLADEPRLQRIAIPEGERVFGVTVVIVDVSKGKREDACIAELELEVEP